MTSRFVHLQSSQQHSSHRFLPTWGAVRLAANKKEKEKMFVYWCNGTTKGASSRQSPKTPRNDLAYDELDSSGHNAPISGSYAIPLIPRAWWGKRGELTCPNGTSPHTWGTILHTTHPISPCCAHCDREIC